MLVSCLILSTYKEMATDDENLDLDTIFTVRNPKKNLIASTNERAKEPARPPTPEPTFAQYYRKKNVDDDSDWTEINIRLVGSHPLWGHYLYVQTSVDSC